jgi:hypothetical protein
MSKIGGYNPQAPQGSERRIVPESVRQAAILEAKRLEKQNPIETTPF